MLWFGDYWPSPLCRIMPAVSTPEGAICAHNCGMPILEGNQGLLIPYLGKPEGMPITLIDDEEGADLHPYLAYHLGCFFDEIGVQGITHAGRA